MPVTCMQEKAYNYDYYRHGTDTPQIVQVVFKSVLEAVFHKHAVLQDLCLVAAGSSEQHSIEAKHSEKRTREMHGDHNLLSAILQHSDTTRPRQMI